MFWSKKQRPTTIISKGTVIEGTIRTDDDIKIYGQIYCKGGEVSVETKGEIYLDSESSILGNLNVSNIDIQGNVYGNVISSGAVVVKQNSKLRGDVKCKSLLIEEGASYMGNIEITKEDL